eukprot:12551220-Ditylum_brightwellii.AAC.1
MGTVSILRVGVEDNAKSFFFASCCFLNFSATLASLNSLPRPRTNVFFTSFDEKLFPFCCSSARM